MKNNTCIPDIDTFFECLTHDMEAIKIGNIDGIELLTPNQRQIVYYFFYYSVYDATLKLTNVEQVSYETFRKQFQDILHILGLGELPNYRKQIHTFEIPLELWKRLTDMFFDTLKHVFQPPYESFQLLDYSVQKKFSDLCNLIAQTHPILFYIVVKHNKSYKKFLKIGWLGGAVETLRAHYYASYRNNTYHHLDYVIEKTIKEQIFISKHDSQILAMYYLKHKDQLQLDLKTYAESVRLSYVILKQHIQNLTNLRKIRTKSAGKKKYNLTEEQIQYIIMSYKEVPTPLIAKNVNVSLSTLYYIVRHLREHVTRKLLKKVPLNTTEAVVAEKFFKGVKYERTTDEIPTEYNFD